MTSFLKLRSSYFADRRRLPKALSVSRQIKRLAHRLHSYSHFPAADLEPLCRSGVILTLHLSQSRRYVTRHSQSCAIAGRPRCSRKVPLAKVLSSFNEKIMLDFSNAGTHGTPYFKDSRYGYIILRMHYPPWTGDSGYYLCPGRVGLVDRIFLSIYCAPAKLSRDVDFSIYTQFKDFLNNFMAKKETWPARRHTQNSTVKAKHGLTRKLVLHLLNDASASHTVIFGPNFNI